METIFALQQEPAKINREFEKSPVFYFYGYRYIYGGTCTYIYIRTCIYNIYAFMR